MKEQGGVVWRVLKSESMDHSNIISQKRYNILTFIGRINASSDKKKTVTKIGILKVLYATSPSLRSFYLQRSFEATARVVTTGTYDSSKLGVECSPTGVSTLRKSGISKKRHPITLNPSYDVFQRSQISNSQPATKAIQ